MKVGTIGTGFIVDWFLNAVKQNEGVEAVGMYSRKEESARPLSEKYGIKNIYTDYKEMLANNDIDTVYIASPNSLHYSYAKEALLAGKHVICEKPFTSTVKEFMELKQLAKEKQLFLFEAKLSGSERKFITPWENPHGTVQLLPILFPL